jgi:predicted protein tyrosine phosphatase
MTSVQTVLSSSCSSSSSVHPSSRVVVQSSASSQQRIRYVRKQYANLGAKGWAECIPSIQEPNVVRLPDQIIPGLFIGDWRDAVNPRAVNFLGITHIISIAGVENYVHYKRLVPRHVELMMFCVEDSDSVSIRSMLNLACDFIHKGRMAGNTLVHCVAGVSRSASFCIAYMIRDLGYSYDNALKILKMARPVCCPNPGFVRQLRDFEKEVQLVTFTLHFESTWGQVLYIVGDTAALGNWKPTDINKMTWTSSSSWSIKLPVFRKRFQYKYIIVNINSKAATEDASLIDESSVVWETCPNRSYDGRHAMIDAWNKSSPQQNLK